MNLSEKKILDYMHYGSKQGAKCILVHLLFGWKGNPQFDMICTNMSPADKKYTKHASTEAIILFDVNEQFRINIHKP